MSEFFVFSFFFGALLFFFPVFVYADVYVDAVERRGWFSLSQYHTIPIFRGYVQLRQEGMVLHLTKKKAILFPYSEMATTRKRFEFTQGFQPWMYEQVTELGSADEVHALIAATIVQTLGMTLYAVAKERFRIPIRSGLILHQASRFSFSVQTAVVLNGYVLSSALIKVILEELIKWMKEKKSTASWKRRHSGSQA